MEDISFVIYYNNLYLYLCKVLGTYCPFRSVTLAGLAHTLNIHLYSNTPMKGGNPVFSYYLDRTHKQS